MENTSDTRTEVLDSLLHSNIKRMAVGVFCGIVASTIMLLVSSFFQVETAGRLWWLQLTGSLIFNGKAFSYSAPPAVYITGLIIHVFLGALCGFIVGKMTRHNELGRMLFYTFVLGFLCWLASNMFGPDFLDFQFLQSIGQWVRLTIFMSFTLSLGFLMSTLGKILKV